MEDPIEVRVVFCGDRVHIRATGFPTGAVFYGTTRRPRFLPGAAPGTAGVRLASRWSDSDPQSGADEIELAHEAVNLALQKAFNAETCVEVTPAQYMAAEQSRN